MNELNVCHNIRKFLPQEIFLWKIFKYQMGCSVIKFSALKTVTVLVSVCNGMAAKSITVFVSINSFLIGIFQ